MSPISSINGIQNLKLKVLRQVFVISNKPTMTTNKYQYLAALSANLSTIAYGIAAGWPSPTIPLLQQNDVIPTGRISVEEGSWIVSLLCIGAILGTFLFGWMVDRTGRKWTFIIASVPHIISYLLIIFTNNVIYLYVSRLLSGIAGGGIFVILPIYVSEISDDKIRGHLGSYLMFGTNFGILVGFIIGGYMDFYIAPYVGLIFSGLFFITFPFFPETPQILLMKNKDEEAENAFRFFHGLGNSIQPMPDNLQTEFDILRKRVKIMNESTKTDETTKITWDDFTVPSTRRGLIITAVLMVLTELCGHFAMINNTTSIFQEAGTDLSPIVSSVIVAAIQLTGSYLSVVLVERAGRKILLISSSLGSGLLLSTMGIYFYLKSLGTIDVSSFNWIPLVSLSAYVLVASYGVTTLPYFVMPEIIPPKLRGIVSTWSLFTIWAFAFILLKFFAALVEAIGIYGCVAFFACYCYAAAIFVMIYMPETKGKSFEAIVKALENKIN